MVNVSQRFRLLLTDRWSADERRRTFIQRPAQGSVITSSSKTVKLDGGTQMLLRVVSP